MPQSALPRSFVPDEPVKLPKSFVPDTPTAQTSGPDLNRIRMDQAAKYPSQQERDAAEPKGIHPVDAIRRRHEKVLTTGLKAIPEAIGIDLESPITGTVKNVVGGLQGLTKSFLSDPKLTKGGTPDQYRQRIEQSDQLRQDVAAGVVHGPSEIIQGIMDGDPERIAAGFGNITGMVIGGKIGQKVSDAIPSSIGLGSKPKPTSPLPESTISAASTMIESGVKNDLVNSYAEQAIPIWKQSAAELGKGPTDFPRRGVRETTTRKIREGGAHAVEIADHAVKIADRPFKEVLKQYGEASIERAGVPPHMTTKGRVLARLDEAAEIHSNNPPLADAIRKLRERVEKAKNFNNLQSLKELANDQSAAFFDKSLGAQINAQSGPAYSWNVLGDSIRAEMYPDLASLSGIDLSTPGRLEAVVMDARDGLRKHYYKDVLNPHNKRMQQTYWEYVRDGSVARRSMLKRALMLEPTPAGMFNQRFNRVIGEPLPMPSSVPVYPKGNASVFDPPTITGAQSDLIPHHAPPQLMPGAGEQLPLMEAPPAVATDIGQSIFGVQQRADRAARIAPPPTLTGTQAVFGEGPRKVDASGNIVFETSTPQHTGQPGRAGEFFPGRRGQTVEQTPKLDRLGKPVLDAQGNPVMEGTKRDYRGQEQLFSVKPTPAPVARFNPMERTTYTMQDLRQMAQEIADFVQANPNHPEVKDLRADLKAVSDEIHARAQAQRTPSAPDDINF